MTASGPGRLGAVVLAGGRSSRFGRDKLAEPVDGRPLLDHAIAAVQGMGPGLDVVVVAAPDGAPDLPDEVRLVHDDRAYEGPLAGLGTGLRSLAGDVDRVIVVGGDMPGLVPAVLRLLVDGLAADAAIDAVVLHDGERARPLPTALRRAAATTATRTLLVAGERRLRALSETLATVVIPAPTWRALDPIGATLGDVDTPADLPPRATRAALLGVLVDDIVGLHPDRRVIVAIDGLDGAGKTILADELADRIGRQRPVVRASEDDFHRPAAERYARGRGSAEGFLRDSYDDPALIGRLLEPFVAGAEVVTGVFDHRADRPRVAPRQPSAPDAVLIVDGIFLHRASLVDRWDRSIWLDVPFEVSIPRVAGRGEGGDPDPTAPSNRRYVQGQRLYLSEVDPAALASWVIDNTDLERPRIVRAPTR